MHIELAPKYEQGIINIITNLNLEAHIINSFNASGETVTLSADKEELEQILNATESDFESAGNVRSEENHPPVTLEGLKAIIKDYMADRI